jgi:hypothetical protein
MERERERERHQIIQYTQTEVAVMKVVTGDETGLLKLINSTKNELKTFGDQDRKLGVKVRQFLWCVLQLTFSIVHVLDRASQLLCHSTF